MPLRKLARDHDSPVATECRAHRFENRGHAVRSLVKNERARLGGEGVEPRRPRAPGGGKETLEDEALHRQAGHGECAEEGARSGYRHHRDVRFGGRAHEHVPRVAHQGRAGVAHEGEGLSIPEAGNDLRRAATLVVLVQGFEAGRNAVVLEESPGTPRILGDHDIHRAEHGSRPCPEIGEVPDRGRNDVEGSGRDVRLSSLRGVPIPRGEGAH